MPSAWLCALQGGGQGRAGGTKGERDALSVLFDHRQEAVEL
jgi:hypothetical protein